MATPSSGSDADAQAAPDAALSKYKAGLKNASDYERWGCCFSVDELCVVVDAGNAHTGKLPVVRVRGKEKEICWRSLYLFTVNGRFRRWVLSIVEWKWFDRFILFLILLNSILLAVHDHRSSDDEGFNWVSNKVLDPILTGFFTIEFVLKVIAWGFVLDRRSYLRELWNWLDFVVVVTALISLIPGMEDSGLGFLRLFRILRPLRSLNAVPEMKILVNTVLKSIPRLVNVTIMMFFCFWIFGIIGLTLLDGIFYHGCRETSAPVLREFNGSSCWEWAYTGDERLCGGRYACDDPPEGVAKGYCGGREDDPNEAVQPVFPGGRRGLEWCTGSEPKKVFPETEFVHFDNIGAALLLVFQCMTMEGWTTIMYYVQDGYGFFVGTVYFFVLIPLTSFFLLNVALAVVDEAREDFKEEAEERESEGEEAGVVAATLDLEEDTLGLIPKEQDEDEVQYWWDVALVRSLHAVAVNEIFLNFIMFVIAANVVTMMMEQFPPQVSWQDFLLILELVFLVIFVMEMFVMLGALGPKGYILNPVTCFDGFIVIISVVQAFASSGGSAFTALRTMRLFRVLNKLASQWPSFRLLLKAVVHTAGSLKYWLVLFLLMLYMITLMCMSFFKRSFHFDDLDSPAEVRADQDQPYCAGSEHETDTAYRQDCIPRAHFDTFLWAFTTVFQIMTGENWNWIMYAGMRARHWLYAALFVFIIVFGQILFLSLFLSMLMSKFDEVQDSLKAIEAQKRTSTASSSTGFKGAVSRMSTRVMGAVARSSVSSQVVPREQHSETETTESTPVDLAASVDRAAARLGGGSEKEEPGGQKFVAVLPGQPDSWTDEEDPPKTGEAVESSEEGRAKAEEYLRAQLDAVESQEGNQTEPPQPEQPPQEPATQSQGTQEPRGSEPQLRPPEQEAGQVGEQAAAIPQQQQQQQQQQQPSEQPAVHPSEPHAERHEEREPTEQQRWPKGVPEAEPAGGAEAPAQRWPSEAVTPRWSAASTPKGSQAGDGLEALPCGPTARSWPYGYALLVFSESNPLRRACRWVLTKQVKIFCTKIDAFDNFILLCILISTVCMATDYPLRDPSDLLTQIIRRADFVFSIIFIVEMVLKLIALGLIWGKNTYLRSAWNWLDGIVVCVSLLGMVSASSGGFLKTLRILRAFRPLRVISRNKNLKVVVQTIFASLPALLTLVIVCLVFLLIFALFGVSYLNGMFYSCQADDLPVVFSRHLGDATPATPLCLGTSMTELPVRSACPRGEYDESSGTWIKDNLGCPGGISNCAHNNANFTLLWQRATADTPICVGRCSWPENAGAPSWLCPRRYRTQEELPSNCGDTSRSEASPEMAKMREHEVIGEAYKASMTRQLVMPCGGTTATADGILEPPAGAVSCRTVFCPNGASSEKAALCEANCKKHPYFCEASCENGNEDTLECTSCRKECQASCECEEHCEPLVRDAALCVEQGGRWSASLPQNFNNIWNSLLTLFEISSTEAWVDVMYAACDANGHYMEPRRDAHEWPAAIGFVVYIFFSFMFLLNLSVGVIVDNFMDLKQTLRDPGREILLTDAQQRWISSRMTLFERSVLFNLTNLHKLPPFRRRLYEWVSSEPFEATMTGAIVANTLVMASKYYPTPTPWWEDALLGMDYFFTFLFTVEFALKMFALRRNYWLEAWNCFDFACVAVAIFGIIFSFAAPDVEILATATQLFRIFRIARLFRLLRSKRLNKIFMALVLSLPKLGNVLIILLLLLVLYSILGVSLFSTMKYTEYINHHANFGNFGEAFILLFRAVTGEAWNSIMHDLLKGETDFFLEGSWCTPDVLFDTSTVEKFDIMKDKCLIDNPNGCVQTIGNVNILPAAYWTSYILIICLMVMNLVIAVILEGYEEGKGNPQAEVIDMCILFWRKYDKDQRMTLPLRQAMRFIHEVISHWLKEQGYSPSEAASKTSMTIPLSSDLSRITMKCINSFQLNLTTDGQVDFLEASLQVLRFACTNNDISIIHEIEDSEGLMEQKEAERLRTLELRMSRKLAVEKTASASQLRAVVAAMKVQRHFRRGAGKKKNWVLEEMQ